MQLPASLQYLDLQISGSAVYLRRDVLVRCTNLRRLKLCFICTDGGLDFSSFTSLQSHHLDSSHCSELATLKELGDLRALRRLDLQHCRSLLRLPELSKSANLQELDISWSTVFALQQEDFSVLAELPTLLPVKITNYPELITLDLVKEKVLKCRTNGTVKEERDLETPPIKVYDNEF